MAKRYKSLCKVHGEKCILSSRVGEDLEDFKQRMKKEGHEVGELFNSDYQLSEKGYLILSKIKDLINDGKVDDAKKSLDQIENEYLKIEGALDTSKFNKLGDKK